MEVSDKLFKDGAKHFARSQSKAMLRMLTGIQDYLGSAEELDKETKSDFDGLKTILLRIETRLE